MIWRKIVSVLILIGAVLLQMYSESYLGGFLLTLAVCLPVLALGLSLPAMLALRVRLSPQQGRIQRGGNALWLADVGNRRHLPLARIELRLQLRNRMTGESRTERLRLSGASSLRRLALPADTGHCGMLECRVVRVKVWDCLGLVSIRRKPPAAALLPVLPVPAEPAPMPEGAGAQRQSAALRVRPGGGSGEDYDLRPYRPGDPIKLIHWKLSSKRDEVIVREVLEARETVPVLSFDHFGPPEVMDAVLDQLCALCAAFLETHRAHTVRWLHPVTGELRECCVGSQRELARCMQMVLSDPAPTEGLSICEGARPVSQAEKLSVKQVWSAAGEFQPPDRGEAAPAVPAIGLRLIPSPAGQGTLQLHIGPVQEEAS